MEVHSYLETEDWHARDLQAFPRDLYPALNEKFMGTLSEAFSKASHAGDFDTAKNTGIELLALYLLVYPSNYPQIGESLAKFQYSLTSHCQSFRHALARNGQDALELLVCAIRP